MQVIPAILTKTTDEFDSQISLLKKYYNRFQIDVADGKFVPNTTLQIENIEKLLTVTELASPIIFDFHLMVNDYEAEIKKIQKLSKYVKVGVILIHYTRRPNLKDLKIKYPNFTFGIVLDPKDEVKTIMSKIDLNFIKDIQIMTINPGFQGSPFIKELLNKVEQLRSSNYRANIYLDGGLNDQTLPFILELKNKPDFLGMGSFLTHAQNLEERVEYLKKALLR